MLDGFEHFTQDFTPALQIALAAKFSRIGTQCTKNKRDELTLDNAFLTTSSPGANALAAQLHKRV